MDNSMTFDQFCLAFNSESICIEAFYAARWSNGFICPKCMNQDHYVIGSRRLPLYQCISCHTQTSLISGTIIEGSRTPLRLWFQAIFLHSQPGGISAKNLASIIGTTYKTAWLICHKIRHAMTCVDSQELLGGLVRVNWGNYGSPYNPSIFRHHQEHPLLVGASIDTSGEFRHLKIKQVHDKHLQHSHITLYATDIFAKHHVDPAAKEIIVINQKYSRNRIKPLIQISLRASRWINKTFKGIGPKHLQSYLDQFCYEYNMRKQNNNFFDALLNACSITPVITYPELIMREDNSAIFKKRYLEQFRNAS